MKKLLCTLGLALLAPLALAQACPEKNVSYWQAFPPGGESDLSARHQQVVLKKKCAAIDTIIQYKAGAGGALMWSQMNQLPGDGLNVVGVNLPHIVFQPLEGQVQYKTADITPVFWFHYTPDILVVPEQSPIKTFADSMQKNGDFRDSCEQWTAMCLGKKGNIAFRTDDLANAEKWLMESIRLRPDRITEDLGLAETTKLGLLLVADKFFRKGDLAKTEALYRAASDLAHGDLDLLNNSGLFARDHGNQLERDGKAKEAMNMYEQSYKAYRRAQQLDPANVRLRNDCALIAIYHLDRDWELSKELLDAAIADGKKMLEENPPSDAQEKQALDEAVGDCYENLALWHLKHSKDYAAAKAAATQSQGHYPGARRGGARRHLQEAERLLQGK